MSCCLKHEFEEETSSFATVVYTGICGKAWTKAGDGRWNKPGKCTFSLLGFEKKKISLGFVKKIGLGFEKKISLGFVKKKKAG